ncbi:arrestin domain-containing protein 3-like isoform X2 [Narcine bancroftii]|uniref:arrestin domain-containing protein 3-like isoform X2 n=1 Tax=Narcine bancroftii TaxID=1343680 RepID=UPI0038313110
MGKVKKIAIVYDRPVYSSGEWVTGRIVVELTDQIEVTALKMHAKAQADVRWTETDSSSEQTQVYTQKLRYFKHKYMIIGSESEEVTVLQSGRHEYPFSLVLPHVPPLPSSFKDHYGNVSYWMTAKLHRPWKLRAKVKEEFTVFNQIDINSPGLLEPLMATDEKTICCWCCASGPIILNAKIERKGYIVGESIQIVAEIENHSSRTVVPKAAIYKTTVYHAKSKSKTCSESIAEVKGDSILAGQKESRNVMVLKIPQVPPTLMNCTIIQMGYSLKVGVSIPGAMNLTVNLPIVIGTIPLHSFGGPVSDFNTPHLMDYSNVNPALPDGPPVEPGFQVSNRNFGYYT